MRETTKKYDSDKAVCENVVEDIMDVIESLCHLHNDQWKATKGPLQAALIKKILMYTFGEYYFTQKRDIKTIVSTASKSGISGYLRPLYFKLDRNSPWIPN